MEPRPANAILVIGSQGFLGKNIRNLLEHHDHLFSSIRGDAKHVFDLYGTKNHFDVFANFDSITVYNCSSGRLQTKELANESNFLFPTNILDGLSRFSSNIIWIQFDSYTQYTSSPIHDVNYVKSKNKFNIELDRRVSVNELLSYFRISLPHLYGVGDNNSRFLPSVFSKLYNGIDIQVTSSRETLALIDVQDCAREVIAISVQPVIKGPKQFRTIFSIAPSENIELYYFLDSFRKYLNSKSLVTRGREDSKVFIEKWNKLEQPPVFLSEENRSSREETFCKLKENLERV